MKLHWLLYLIVLFFSIDVSLGKTSIIGEVTKIDVGTSSFTVKPTDPDGPAITVKVAPGDLNTNYLNKKIKATLVTEVNPAELQEIWPYDPEFERRVKEINLTYLASSLTPNAPCLIKIGDTIPPFALYDQNGSTVTHKDILGKMVVMNFIFTRCGVPTRCPAATRKMAELSKLVRDRFLQDEVRFVTISFDPQSDTPGVLNQYARGYEIDLSNYSFLTGDAEMIKRLTRIFGIFAVTEKGTINHTMKTVIIDKNGTVVYGISETDWQPTTLFDVIKKILKV